MKVNFKKEQFILKSEHSKKEHYTVISNKLITSNLSADALYLIIKVLKEFPTYKFYVEEMKNKYSWDKRRTKKAIEELIEKGYCIKINLTKKSVYYYFFENPDDNYFICSLENRYKNVPLKINNSSLQNVFENLNYWYKNVPLKISEPINNEDRNVPNEDKNVLILDENVPNEDKNVPLKITSLITSLNINSINSTLVYNNNREISEPDKKEKKEINSISTSTPLLNNSDLQISKESTKFIEPVKNNNQMNIKDKIKLHVNYKELEKQFKHLNLNDQLDKWYSFNSKKDNFILFSIENHFNSFKGWLNNTNSKSSSSNKNSISPSTSTPDINDYQLEAGLKFADRCRLTYNKDGMLLAFDCDRMFVYKSFLAVKEITGKPTDRKILENVGKYYGKTTNNRITSIDDLTKKILAIINEEVQLPVEVKSELKNEDKSEKKELTPSNKNIVSPSTPLHKIDSSTFNRYEEREIKNKINSKIEDRLFGLASIKEGDTSSKSSFN